MAGPAYLKWVRIWGVYSALGYLIMAAMKWNLFNKKNKNKNSKKNLGGRFCASVETCWNGHQFAAYNLTISFLLYW